ncbi:MAG: hypothetical protein V3V08_07220 [Nannocystaceae bacterium]
MNKPKMGRPTKYGDETAPNVTITMPAALERALTHEAKLREMSRSAMACKVLLVGMRRLAARGIVAPLPDSVWEQLKTKVEQE